MTATVTSSPTATATTTSTGTPSGSGTPSGTPAPSASSAPLLRALSNAGRGAGADGSVMAMAAVGSGTLVIGGFFDTVAGHSQPVGNVVAWHHAVGGGWQPMTGAGSPALVGVNGAVYAITALNGTHALAAGEFSHIGRAFVAAGPTVCSVVVVDVVSGRLSPAIDAAGVNGVAGPVYAAAGDGAGRAWLGGAFAGGGCDGVATIPADGIIAYSRTANAWSSVATPGGGFGVSSPAPGVVYALAFSPALATLFIGGAFTQATALPVSNVAAVNVTTGVWSSLTDAVTGSEGVVGNVNALAVTPDGLRLVLGGSLTSSGSGGSAVMAAGIMTWRLATRRWEWFDEVASPGQAAGVIGSVQALLPTADPHWVVAGGGFTSRADGSEPLSALALVNVANGTTLPLITAGGEGVRLPSSSGGTPQVYALVVLGGGAVGVGGNFGALPDGASVRRGAVLKAASCDWFAACGPDGWQALNGSAAAVGVAGEAMAIACDAASETCWVGGAFERLSDGTQVNNVAQVDVRAGTWAPIAEMGMPGVLGGSVAALVSMRNAAGHRLWVGGSAGSTATTLPMNGVACFDLVAGTWVFPIDMTSFASGVAGTVSALAAWGDYVVVGGSFATLSSGAAANNVALFHTVDSVWSVLQDGGGPPGVNGAVTALLVAGQTLVIGGSFSSSPSSRVLTNIATWSNVTGAFESLPPSTLTNGVNGAVQALALTGAGRILVGGQFSSPTSNPGLPMPFIGQYDPATANWSTLPGGQPGQEGTSAAVRGLTALPGPNGTVAVVGDFANAGGALVAHVALWSATGGSDGGAAWTPLATDNVNPEAFNGVGARQTDWAGGAAAVNDTHVAIVGAFPTVNAPGLPGAGNLAIVRWRW